MHEQLLRATAYDFLSLSGDLTLDHIDFELVDAKLAGERMGNGASPKGSVLHIWRMINFFDVLA
ncbi:hypothetical protein Pyn_10350 [Prunus yedoensis var. nudiflora]|uniref:Uncharacterized protein n=1 Tax=Prunus yedoensis var. nudiflora TaxID=2094558 RepID=A0A314YLG0_PRUYE|nr:hypothetical protein Pyn_10350 [Prunus yedoensis var. nudiflora]